MHDMTAAQVVSSSRVLVDRGSTAVMGSIDHGVRLTSARMIDMIDFYQFLAFIIHCAYAFLGFSWGMVRVGAQDAKSSVVTGPRMAITTSRWTFSLLDASASAEPYRVSLFSLGWELVGVCCATHSEWILNQLNTFYIILPYFPPGLFESEVFALKSWLSFHSFLARMRWPQSQRYTPYLALS